MISKSRREANDLVKDEIRNSRLDPLMKEAIIQNLTESLEGTNGYDNKEKLQKVSECTEGQSRIIARLCLMQDAHHARVRESLDKLSKKLDDSLSEINGSIGKIIDNPKDNTKSEPTELKSRAQWFKFLTINKTPVFWFSVIIIVLAFVTGNIDRIVEFFKR